MAEYPRKFLWDILLLRKFDTHDKISLLSCFAAHNARPSKWLCPFACAFAYDHQPDAFCPGRWPVYFPFSYSCYFLHTYPHMSVKFYPALVLYFSSLVPKNSLSYSMRLCLIIIFLPGRRWSSAPVCVCRRFDKKKFIRWHCEFSFPVHILISGRRRKGWAPPLDGWMAAHDTHGKQWAGPPSSTKTTALAGFNHMKNGELENVY